ncbi:hypothetical protein NDU88_003324 [Pleurodeles waltl]|uniref:Uncharacterized protein n=1 Tax=Pleurodeles waltl TaxID=8319 RepID=A0AAV7RES0_PLEWA|nr:hypothetical protein NDU88_003324 [Pleurodeles waltl]
MSVPMEAASDALVYHVQDLLLQELLKDTHVKMMLQTIFTDFRSYSIWASYCKFVKVLQAQACYSLKC